MGRFHQASPNFRSAYAALQNFTLDLQKFYTDISAVSVTFRNSVEDNIAIYCNNYSNIEGRGDIAENIGALYKDGFLEGMFTQLRWYCVNQPECSLGSYCRVITVPTFYVLKNPQYRMYTMYYT